MKKIILVICIVLLMAGDVFAQQGPKHKQQANNGTCPMCGQAVNPGQMMQMRMRNGQMMGQGQMMQRRMRKGQGQGQGQMTQRRMRKGQGQGQMMGQGQGQMMQRRMRQHNTQGRTQTRTRSHR